MTALEMNAELFRQLSLIAEDETMMEKVLKYLRSLTVVEKEPVKVAKKKPYKVIPVSPEISRWSGCASFTEEEIESDPRLKALLSR